MTRRRGLLALGLALLALLALGVVIVAIEGIGGDSRVEPLPPLPTPHPAHERAMVSLGVGSGWTWINPLPRAMPSWYAVARSEHAVAMVGLVGAAVRYQDRSLFLWNTHTQDTLRAVAWINAREAIAAGENGALLRLGEGVQALDSGVQVMLRAAAGLDAGAIVAGDGGTVLRVLGDRVERVSVPVQADFYGAHALGHAAFVVGAQGAIVRIENGESITETSGTEVTLFAIGGCPERQPYAGGEGGVMLHRQADASWRPLIIAGSAAITGIACDHGRVAATRADGTLLLISGLRSMDMPTGTHDHWNGISGGPQGSTWMVGVGGRISTIEDDHVRGRTAGPILPIRALGSMGGAIIAVGEWGHILRETQHGFVEASSPTQSGLGALLQLDEGRLLAIGDYGTIVDIRFDSAQLVEAPLRDSLRAGIVQGERLLLVGADGAVVRGELGALSGTHLEDVSDLWSVTGTPNDAIAVGAQGVVVHMTPGHNQRWSCGDMVLRAVMRTPEGTWACGDGGYIARLDNGTCEVERQSGPTLHALGFGPSGRLLAVGDGGTAITRGADGSWAAETVDVGQVSLRNVWRSDRDVFLAGTGGAIVRHIRLDR